jgi:DNA mismatch repair protein MutL
MIKELSRNLVSKIAAGEVVDRPSSVVKELVENAIDADATSIKIEIENAGLRVIKVTDDGIGMSREDLLHCFLPHTTSKIKHEDDLFSIVTKGFRGEALSSIAAVSDLVIKSRPRDEISGFIVEVVNQQLARDSIVGMPIGASVVVKNLFKTIPARKKFLKSIRTEFRFIAEVVVKAALAHPEISFFLAHDKRIILDLPSQQSVSERVRMLLGGDVAQNLLPVEYESEHYKISGYIAKPQVNHSTKDKQFLFVNQRVVGNKLISDAVKEAFGSTLMTRRYPVFILFFDVPHNMVDVNIHPRKDQVAFADGVNAYDLFKEAVLGVIDSESLGYEKDVSVEDFEYDFYDFDTKFVEEGSSYTDGFENTPIMQLHRLYLIKPTRKGVLLVDQHAAHEKILYEKFLENYRKNKTSISCPLESSIIVKVSLVESEALLEYLPAFEKMGFELEDFGNGSFKLGAVPLLAFSGNISDVESFSGLISDILSDLMQGKTPKSIDENIKRVLSMTSCRLAIKSGDYLDENERADLLRQLENTKTGYTCPHGRPAKIEITLEELGRMFKRK